MRKKRRKTKINQVKEDSKIINEPPKKTSLRQTSNSLQGT